MGKEEKFFLKELAELLTKHNATLCVEYDHEKGGGLSFDLSTRNKESVGNFITDDVFYEKEINALFISKLIS